MVIVTIEEHAAAQKAAAHGTPLLHWPLAGGVAWHHGCTCCIAANSQLLLANQDGPPLQVVSLITIEVHARDMIEKLGKANCSSPTDFEWVSQLRFYWDRELNDCIVKQVGLDHNRCCTSVLLSSKTLDTHESCSLCNSTQRQQDPHLTENQQATSAVLCCAAGCQDLAWAHKHQGTTVLWLPQATVPCSGFDCGTASCGRWQVCWHRV